MKFQSIPTEVCYLCKAHNQPVFNKREMHTLQGLRRVHLCDACHKKEMEKKVLNAPKLANLTIPIKGYAVIATESNLRKLLKVLGE